MHKCVKCGKEKPDSETHEYEGQKYCCSVCCGDPGRGEHQQKKDTPCEFC